MARTPKKTPLPTSGYHRIPMGLIDESPTNPRKAFDADELQELADSIRVHGVHQPAIVRRRGDRFELICGARRFRASKMVNQDELPVIVLDLDDVAALELQLEENNQRRDVTDLEEAEAIVMLHETYGRSIADVAAHLGRSVPFVRSRVELGRAAPAVKRLLQDGMIRVGGAMLLARAPSDVVDGLAEKVRREAGHLGVVRERDLGRFVWEFARLIGNAPFDVADGTLTGRGACLRCPDRTGAQVAMFEGCSDSADRCLDAACWDIKVAALWVRAKKDAGKRHLSVLSSVWDRSNPAYAEADGKAWKLGSSKTYRELVGEDALLIGRDESGRVIELAHVEAARKAFEAAGAEAGEADLYEDDDEDAPASSGSARTPGESWELTGDRRRLEQIAGHKSALERLDAVGETALAEWLVKKLCNARHVALRRELIEPGASFDAAVAQVEAWAETASMQEVFVALAEDLLWNGELDNEETFDGLLGTPEADDDGQNEEAAQ